MARKLLRQLNIWQVKRHLLLSPPHPSPRGQGRPKSPHISFAHSGPGIACAISDLLAVGIDIEYIDPARDIDGIARAAFGPKEQMAVKRIGFMGFYRIWCLREAYAKATGLGFAAVVDGKDRFSNAAHGRAGFFRVGSKLWCWRTDMVSTSYMLAVVALRQNTARMRLARSRTLAHGRLMTLV